jgi:hypothetical protein
MLTIQQLFQKIDAEQFVKEFVNYNISFYSDKIFDLKNPANIDNSYYERLVASINNTLNSFRTTEIKENKDNVVFVVPINEDDYFVYDSFFIKKEDILENNKQFDTYAYELNDYSETLGYGVSEACIYLLGEIATAVGIFSEMTFCGIDIDERASYVNDITDSLKEAITEINESDLQSFKTMEDFFSEIGFVDERSLIEKNFDKTKFEIYRKIARLKYNFLFEQERFFETGVLETDA